MIIDEPFSFSVVTTALRFLDHDKVKSNPKHENGKLVVSFIIIVRCRPSHAIVPILRPCLSV